MGAASLSHRRAALFDNRHPGDDAALQQENPFLGDAFSVRMRRQLNCKSGLLYPGAAALNQNHQHDYKQHPCGYPDNCRSIHRHYGFLPLRESYMRFVFSQPG